MVNKALLILSQLRPGVQDLPLQTRIDKLFSKAQKFAQTTTAFAFNFGEASTLDAERRGGSKSP
jgi:hypothetical protein